MPSSAWVFSVRAAVTASRALAREEDASRRGRAALARAPRRASLLAPLVAGALAIAARPARAAGIETMAWRSHGRTNDELVDNLYRNEIITEHRVARAMKSVDRANYVAMKEPSIDPYQDSPQPIGYGATISAPHMHAHCLQELSRWLVPGAKVLDVGSGTGYLTALFAEMVTPDGVVVGVDHVDELVRASRENFHRGAFESRRFPANLSARPSVSTPDLDASRLRLTRQTPERNDPRADGKDKLLAAGEVILATADGRNGWPGRAPYDAIHVGAASPSIPEALIEQLAPGGRLIIPVGREHEGQTLKAVDKGAFAFTLVPVRPRWRGERRSLRTFLPGVCFSPPTSRFRSRHTATPFDSV